MNVEFASVIFGKGAEIYLPFLISFEKLVNRITYKFIPEQEYILVLKENPSEGMRIYWAEMLDRAHLAATTSMLRNKRWINGVVFAVENDNLLVFASAFRGLIESAADAFDGLRPVPISLSENYDIIKSALEGKLKGAIICCKTLEDSLIHFSHARRLSKGHTEPEIHRAKTSREYLDLLKKIGDGEILNCYSELCEITHPAAASIAFLFDQKPKDEYQLSLENDAKYIINFCAKYKSIMSEILQLSFNLALLTLRVLNSFPVDKLKTPILNELSFESIRGWQNIKNYIK